MIYNKYTFFHQIKLILSVCCSCRLLLQMPEALTTFCRTLVQIYNPHDNSYLQPAVGGQFTPAENGKVHRLMQQKKKVTKK